MSMTRKHYIEFADAVAEHINTRKLFEDRQAIWYFAMHSLLTLLRKGLSKD